MKQVFGFLWNAIKNYWAYYGFMLVATIAGAFYKPIVYLTVKMMIDIISTTPSLTFQAMSVPLLIYIAADLSISLVWRLSQAALWKSEPYVQQGILLNVLERLLSYPMSFFQNHTGGSLVSKVKGVFDGYSELWAQLYYGVSFWMLASITTAVSLILVNQILGTIILGWAALFITINYKLAGQMNFLSESQNNAKHSIIGEIADSINNVQTVKLFASRHYEYARLKDKISADFVPKEIRLYKFQFKVDVLDDILGISTIIIMLMVMIQLKRLNLISVGDFVFVFGMMFQFQENLWRLMQEYHKLVNRAGDLKSSLSIMEAATSEYEKSNVVIKTQLPGIEFRNISFSYKDNKQIFADLNLYIKPGQRVGIVGYTGAGKTTLINLLLKTYSLKQQVFSADANACSSTVLIPNQGSIWINNQDIAALDNDALRELIAVIPQDISLFHRNLMENIRYGRLGASDEEVIAASIKAHADEFIQKLPQGYHTLVGERGVKLSGGQRQRIAIARAILKNAPILVLDEATSSLDSITEKYIQDSIQDILNNKTVIAIAHRLSTLKTMDRLVVIDKGQIVEMGTHDELIRLENSLYAKIWHTQYSIN